MQATDYNDLSDLALLELCVWREARGEQSDAKKGVALVIRNRVYGATKWWGTDWHSVILHPWQFSSFNEHDPNAALWPSDTDTSFSDVCQQATPVYLGTSEDITQGALFYHDMSMGWPAAWGKESDYVQTLAVGRLLFFKPAPVAPPMGVDEATQV
jgi:hypothetical protein